MRRPLSAIVLSIGSGALIASLIASCAQIQGLDQFEKVDCLDDCPDVVGSIEGSPTAGDGATTRDGPLTCALPLQACNGLCTNTAADPLNCGSCGHACSFSNAIAGCTNGACVRAGCAAGYTDCSDAGADGGCGTDKNGDALNCGACGNVCALGETCASGSCTSTFTGGLIGYWMFDDSATSNVAKDSSGNNLSGNFSGTVTFVPGQGKQGRGAASFVGNGYIDVSFPNNARNQGTGVFIPQGNITFAMWIKSSAPIVQGLQVLNGNATWGTGCDRVIGNGAAGPLNYNAWSEENIAGRATVNDGNWHHVAYVLDKTNGLIAYVDGAVDGTDANPTSCGIGCSAWDGASEYLIGTGSGCRYSASDFTGLIDDVRLYDHVLTASQVTALFNATK